jgi:hypothetical protein
VAAALALIALIVGALASGGEPGGSAAPTTTPPTATSEPAVDGSGTTAAPTTAPPTTGRAPSSPRTTVPTYTDDELLQQFALGLAPLPMPPLGESLPYTLAVIDDGGTAHLVDLATGLVGASELTIGTLEGANVSEVVGGPRGPVALRASMTRYGVTELDQPDPRWIEGRAMVAYDEDTGWYWFASCFIAPCERFSRLTGFGPLESERTEIELPTPTERVAATGGKLYVEAAGAVVAIDPAFDVRQVVATGRLLDARGTKVVVRSCATDLACPVYIIDSSGGEPLRVEISGDDIQLSPDGATLVAGAGQPMLATTLALVDALTGERLDVDADVLRFVSVPFRFSPDGDWLFAATATRAIVALRIADKAVHRFQVAGLDRPIAGLLVRTPAVD